MPKKTKIIVGGAVVIVLLGIVAYVNLWPAPVQTAPPEVMDAALEAAAKAKAQEPPPPEGPPVSSKPHGMGGGKR